MGAGLGTQVGLGDDDDIQRVYALLMEQLHLVEASRHVPLDRSLFEGGHRHVVVIDLRALLATRTAPGIGAGVGEIQCRIVPQLGNQVQMALPRPLQGVVVATAYMLPENRNCFLKGWKNKGLQEVTASETRKMGG